MADFNIKHADLSLGAVGMKKKLLILATHRLAECIHHMHLEPGVRYKMEYNEATADDETGEMGPYNPHRENNANVDLDTRELEVFLGSCIEKFDPNKYYRSAYSILETKGEAITKHKLVQVMAALLAKSVSKKLYRALWSAVRNPNGSKTKDLFNGFDTITALLIAAGDLHVDKGNYIEIPPISRDNAVDTFQLIVDSANEFLLDEDDVKLFCDKQSWLHYCYDYEAIHDHKPLKDELKRTFVEAASSNVEIVPMANKTGSQFIHLSTKENMLIGVDRESEDEVVNIEKHHGFILDFIMAMRFGVEFMSISPERLFVAKIVNA